MRLFLAIELPAAVRRHLHEVQSRVGSILESSASLTRQENLHVTLKFLGEAPDRDVPRLCESLARVSAPGRIEIGAERIECFPPRGQVRIVAADMGGSQGPLRALHDAVEQRCHHLGFPRETRRYRPHVTVARPRRPLPADVRERLVSASADLFPGPRFSVTEFVLMQSVLKAGGSEYSVASRFPIGG